MNLFAYFQVRMVGATHDSDPDSILPVSQLWRANQRTYTFAIIVIVSVRARTQDLNAEEQNVSAEAAVAASADATRETVDGFKQVHLPTI